MMQYDKILYYCATILLYVCASLNKEVKELVNSVNHRTIEASRRPGAE